MNYNRNISGKFDLKRLILAGGAIIFIIFQHYYYYTTPKILTKAPRIYKSTSIREPEIYDYSLYYWGIVPAYNVFLLDLLSDPTIYNQETANKFLSERGEGMRMEHIRSLRCGERMVKIIKYPLMLLKGTPYQVSHHTVIGFLFVLSLTLLTLALTRYAPLPLCVFLPILLSSSGFLARSVYERRLTFALLPITVIIGIALFCPLIFERSTRIKSILLRIVIFSALLVVTVNIRTTALAAILCPIAAIAMYPRLRLFIRLALMIAVIFSFSALENLFNLWWNAKYNQTTCIVAETGGVPFSGPRIFKMPFWHSLWCGLADFDNQFGYLWRDVQAFNFANPILKAKEKYPKDKSEDGGYVGGVFPGLYPWDIPQYEKVIQDKVLSDILSNPKWYATILLKRARRILFENESPGFAFRGFQLRIPLSWFFYLVALLAIPAFGLRAYATVVLSVLPTAAVAMFCTTFGGQQYKSMLHIVLLALLLTALCRLIGSVVRFGKLLLLRHMQYGLRKTW